MTLHQLKKIELIDLVNEKQARIIQLEVENDLLKQSISKVNEVREVNDDVTVEDLSRDSYQEQVYNEGLYAGWECTISAIGVLESMRYDMVRISEIKDYLSDILNKRILPNRE